MTFYHTTCWRPLLLILIPFHFPDLWSAEIMATVLWLTERFLWGFQLSLPYAPTYILAFSCHTVSPNIGTIFNEDPFPFCTVWYLKYALPAWQISLCIAVALFPSMLSNYPSITFWCQLSLNWKASCLSGNMVDQTWEFAGAHMYRRVLSNSRSWLQTRLVCLLWRAFWGRQSVPSRYGWASLLLIAAEYRKGWWRCVMLPKASGVPQARAPILRHVEVD